MHAAAGRRPPTRRALRDFALLVGGALMLVALLLARRGRPTPAAIVGAAGLLLAALGLAVPQRLGVAYQLWMGLALAMSRVTTPIFMGAVYFALLTPIALVRRLLGARLGAPGWVARPPGARRSDMTRQF